MKESEKINNEINREFTRLALRQLGNTESFSSEIVKRTIFSENDKSHHTSQEQVEQDQKWNVA